MTLEELEKREAELETQKKVLQLKRLEIDMELDFIYDRYSDMQLEADAQRAEAFPGQPQRSER